MLEQAEVLYDPLYPQPWYHYMCETTPFVLEEKTHLLQVFRFQDVQRVLLDTKTFSSEVGLGRGMEESVIAYDPPRHRKLRDLVAQQFTPRAIAQLEERITAIVHKMLDEVITTGQMDMVDDLAHPFPTTVIAELLGVPAEDSGLFRVWSDAIVERFLTPEREQRLKAEMDAYFLHVIEQRRRKPENDLISALLTAEIDGERLSERELLSFCVLLLVAGNETTTSLIGNAMVCFDTFPEAFQDLREHPALVPSALEEVLRYRSPANFLGRVATTDVVLGDREIKAGQHLSPMVAAANLDERAFPHALTFDIRRNPNRHIAFGHGIHFCLGAPLTRLEAKVVFTVLLERLADIRRVQDMPLEPIMGSSMQGIKHFPITFKPGPRLSK